MEVRRIATFVVAICCFITIVKAQKQDSRQLQIESKETNSANFFRLLIMRLIFGLASAMGYGDSLSNFLGGILVPPGSDYDDDYGDYVPDLF